MKKMLFGLIVLFGGALTLLPNSVRSQAPVAPGKGYPADLGPGEKGATLRQPWLDPGSTPAPLAPGATAPNYVQTLLNGTGATPPPASSVSGTYASLLPYDTTGLNNDILISRELGEWMILVISYAGKEGPMRARKMVTELRASYKLPAYVFNYGAEEKRKELERVKEIVAKQKEALKNSNLTVDQPLRIRHYTFDEHCGVLIGGFATADAAAAYRDKLRRLPDPDPKVFRLNRDGDLLDMKFFTSENGKEEGQAVYVNPFKKAFVVRNPTIKVERPADWDKLDVAALKRMNSEEPYSLLKCDRKYTLVIKQFSTPSVTAPRNDSSNAGFWDTLSFGKKSEGAIDIAAKNATELAKGLRLAKLDAFVLHTKYYSLVTVGGYDSPDDPNLRSMQNVIKTRLNPVMEGVQLLPTPMPMPIPH